MYAIKWGDMMLNHFRRWVTLIGIASVLLVPRLVSAEHDNVEDLVKAITDDVEIWKESTLGLMATDGPHEQAAKMLLWLLVDVQRLDLAEGVAARLHCNEQYWLAAYPHFLAGRDYARAHELRQNIVAIHPAMNRFLVADAFVAICIQETPDEGFAFLESLSGAARPPESDLCAGYIQAAQHFHLQGDQDTVDRMLNCIESREQLQLAEAVLGVQPAELSTAVQPFYLRLVRANSKIMGSSNRMREWLDARLAAMPTEDKHECWQAYRDAVTTCKRDLNTLSENEQAICLGLDLLAISTCAKNA
ncbi:MAG: hypothetical protein KDB27_03230, partial [Planctomycetales bacterium]|nr:hypothetical protein [Planctomycetales bacterium]